MFKEYTDWITENEHNNLLREVVYAPNWRFGQTSDDSIEPNYPCWFQGFYNFQKWDYIPSCPQVIKDLGNRFLELVPDNYLLIRCMASSNTFGIDGDFHTDWPHPDVSITGVLYTDKEWETNWGGSTMFKDGDKLGASEYVPRKLITFDSSIPHIGCGPQRRCKEMRSIIAFQATHVDAIKKRVGEGVKKDAPKQKVVQRFNSDSDTNIDIVS